MGKPLLVQALSLLPIAALSLIAWVVCSVRSNVGLIDVFWPLFLLAAGVFAALSAPELSNRDLLILATLTLWAMRLCVHLAVRNWNAPEDRRYRAVRARHQPGFVWKSLFLVFLFQAMLAWVISAPIVTGIAGSAAWSPRDAMGLALAVFGIVFEALADRQLTAFLARKRSSDAVLDTGLWRYSRHPNYFGECCVWWGFFLMIARPETLWTVISPVLMTVLLLRVTGVTLLEKDLAARRPAYRQYVQRTPAFFPWRPKGTGAHS